MLTVCGSMSKKKCNIYVCEVGHGVKVLIICSLCKYNLILRLKKLQQGHVIA
jgi:hypothetical protein